MKLTDKVLVLSGVYKEQIFMANDSFFSFFLFLGVIRLLESGINLREVSSQRYPVLCCQSVKLGVSVTKIHQEKDRDDDAAKNNRLLTHLFQIPKY